MNNYYGDSQKNDKQVSSSGSSVCNQILISLSAVLGLISLLVIIALNVANLTEIYRTKTDSGKLTSLSDTITRDLDVIKTEIIGDIKPKTNLINNMASYKIPAMITAHTKVLQSDILRFCAPRYETTGKNCPVVYNPIHSGLFSLYDLDFPDECTNMVTTLRSTNNITFVQFASFIPSSTNVAGCSRIPSFSLSNTIYAYTHNMMERDCSDSGKSTQFWSLGKIGTNSKAQPIFTNIMNWYLADGINRKSCSTVAGIDGAWMGCTIVNQTEREDYNTPGIQSIYLGYMDVFGRKRQWYYTENQIEFDYPYDALYFSVGSGIIIENQVYFLAYGALRNPINEPAYCHSPGCNNPSQEACNRAQRVWIFGSRQVVSALVTFEDRIVAKPTLHVRTIMPSQYPLGAEGRLYYFKPSNQIYIYLRSTNWHALLLFGKLSLGPPITIEWMDFEVFSRPGSSPCGAISRCPVNCMTGVYTDYFPLRLNGSLGVSVILRSQTNRVNPTIRLATLDTIVKDQTVTSLSQEAGYTTTTCFMFSGKTWCLSIIEMYPASVGIAQPISLLYQVNARCTRIIDDDEGSGFLPTVAPVSLDSSEVD